MDHFCDCGNSYSFKDYLQSFVASCFCCCCMFPVALGLFLFCISIPCCFILFAPPFTILFSALPFLKANKMGLYKKYQSSNAYERADPSEQGHEYMWYEIGWVRAFILCCFLTLFGWFPGVAFASYIIFKFLIGTFFYQTEHY